MEDLPIRDKMAVVFHGIVGGMNGRNGLGDPVNIADCAKIIKHHILSAYDHDIFIHSWAMDHEKEIKSLYNPTNSLFQPQEYFQFKPNPSKPFSDNLDETAIYFRTVSRYNSLQRAVRLKQNYEIANGFRYKWVFIIRFDIVFYKKLDLSVCDPNYIYVCREPAWPNIHSVRLVHDTMFLSSSKLMDEYANLASEMKTQYTTQCPHTLAYQKLMDMGKKHNNPDIIQFLFKRFVEAETYRQVITPDPNNFGSWEAGSLLCKGKLEELLKTINENENKSIDNHGN